MSDHHIPRAQNALLAIYRQAQACGQSMPTMREAAAQLGISHIRVRQLNVKLCERGAIDVEHYAHRGVRVLNDESESMRS